MYIAVKVVPLLIKNLVVSAINAKMQRGITGTISNVGKITVPEEMEPYIQKFSCFMAAPEVQICLCSYKDELVFGVASAFIQQPVIRDFFRDMVDMGIEVVLESNDFDRGTEVRPAAQAGGGAVTRPDVQASCGAATRPDVQASCGAATRPGVQAGDGAVTRPVVQASGGAATETAADASGDPAGKEAP